MDGVSAWGWIDEQASWTWPGQEGKPLLIQAYSSCPHVRLTLNGRDLGVKDTDRRTHFTATWKLPYEPGMLTAFGEVRNWRELARWTLRTAGKPAAVRLTPDRPEIRADGQDLCFVTVEVVDEHGVVNPNAGNLLQFTVAGPATVLAVSNGDPRSIREFPTTPAQGIPRPLPGGRQGRPASRTGPAPGGGRRAEKRRDRDPATVSE